MSQVKRNTLANFIGKGWTAVVSIVLVPVYINLMGVEAYGLVGIFMTLQVISNLLDMGLSPTLSREVARLSVLPEKVQETRDLVRTIEIIQWALAGGIALIAVPLSYFIAHYWVDAKTLSTAMIQQAVMIMGLVTALQFLFAYYSGGLLGLQKQVPYNAIVVSMTTLRSGGAALVLWLVSPTVRAFFLWQLIVAAVQAAITFFLLWRYLPVGERPARFRLPLLKEIWRFAAGITGITLLISLLSVTNTGLLSKLLPLETFGYYTIAVTISSGVTLLVTPIFTAIFPRFSQLVSLNNQADLKTLYHFSCQVMSVVIIPACMVIILFAPEVLWVWTGSKTTTEETHFLVSLLVTGTLLNSLMNIPYALQLAYGWTKLTFYQTLFSLLFLIPLLYFAVIYYGAPGAAVIWVLLSIGQVTITLPLMHRRLLIGELKKWYLIDSGLPLITSLIIGRVFRILINSDQSRLMTAGYLGVVIFVTVIATGLITPEVRNATLTLLREKVLSYTI